MKSIVATLEEKILGAQQRLDGLRQTVSGADVDSQHLLPSALEELSSALEELHASADELEARNEELAHAHDAVERERRRYLELFEFAPDAYLVTDTLGTIGEANAAAATLLHRRQYFLVGKPLAIFVAPPTHPDFYETLNNLQRGVADRSEDREIHLLLHDGAALDVAVSASAVRDRSGQITGIRWLLRDITERKRIAALRAERASLSAFSSAVGLALTETGTVEAALQRCAAAMVEHLGAALARIWTMNDAAQVLELQASAGMYTHIDGRHSRIPLGELKIGRIAQQRQPHLTNSVVGDPHIHDQDWVQREHLVAFAGYPLVLAENTVVGVIAMFARQPIGDETLIALAAVAREIALGIEHKHTEQRLAGALQEIEHIMETVPDIIYTLDAEARLIRWNRKMETATGLSPQELRGRPATNFFPDDQRAVISAAIQLALATGYSEAEVELLGPGGTAVPYHWSAAPLKDDHGRVIGLTGTGTDISERRRADEALSQLSRRLIQLQDEERRRIGRELHDSTAQNLAGLAMNLALVTRSSERLNRPARHALDESLALVDQCLAEIRTISYLLHPPLLDEVGLASAIRWYAEGFAQRSGIRVDLAIAPEFGRLSQEIETALFRIVQEALTNVHRHSGSPTVGIQILHEAGTITLEISDEGRGLSSEVTATAAETTPLMGVGIRGMQERVRQLGGELALIPRQSGLTVRATVPVAMTAL